MTLVLESITVDITMCHYSLRICLFPPLERALEGRACLISDQEPCEGVGPHKGIRSPPKCRAKDVVSEAEAQGGKHMAGAH